MLRIKLSDNIKNALTCAEKDALEEFDYRPYPFFINGNIKKYPRLAKLAVEAIIDANPFFFFKINLKEEYPELEEAAAKSLVGFEQSINAFIDNGLHKKYAKLLLEFK